MHHPFKKTFIALAAAALFAVPQAFARDVQDIQGNTVTVPDKVERIADLWHANNQVVLLLGGADKLIGTTNFIHKNPWYNLVYPRIKDVPVLTDGKSIQAEELLAARPDAVLTSSKTLLQEVQNAGMPGVLVSFQDFDGLKKTVKITADVIGGDAPAIAETYIKELNDNIAFVSERVKDIPDDARPTVVHIAGGEELLKIDGGKSMIGSWVTMAGGKNALPDEANLVTVSMEEIVKVNPQVIIIGSSGGKAGEAIEKIKKDPAWQSIDAVKNGRLYPNPSGTFPWDRYSAEEALQVLWAGKLFHPEKFADVDMVEKTKAFYQKYYHYELSDDNAKRILSGDVPAKK